MKQAITQSEKADTLIDLLTPDLIELMREAHGDLEALEAFCGFCASLGLDYLDVTRAARNHGLLN